MTLDLASFLQAINPKQPLMDAEHYYVNFSDVRGSNIIQAMLRTITYLPPTCQLFTGHSGCGKSTELLRIKAELEHQGFHVVYFEFEQRSKGDDLPIEHEIIIEIARKVMDSLAGIGIKLKPSTLSRISKMANKVWEILTQPVKVGFELERQIPGVGKGKFSVTTEGSPEESYLGNTHFWEYLESPTSSILQFINTEIIERANKELAERSKKLVVIVDNLDKIPSKVGTSERSLAEYLFIDRSEVLKGLSCHVVYTMPLSLMYSKEFEKLKRLGEPKKVGMVRLKSRDGHYDREALALFKQIVLCRAFPNSNQGERLSLITEIFDTEETLDRLCLASGGHVKQLLRLLFRCVAQDNIPLQRSFIEKEIEKECNNFFKNITDSEWNFVCRVMEEQFVKEEAEKQALLESLQKMFLFEYSDRFSINPILAEAKGYQL